LSGARCNSGDTVRIALLREALFYRPRPVDELLGLLQVSRATFARTIQNLADEVVQFRQPGVRIPGYATVRKGPVSFLQGGGTWMDLGGPDSRFHKGLPHAMAFAAPTGYLGARIARAFAMQLGVPSSLRDWSDEHRKTWRCARSGMQA